MPCQNRLLRRFCGRALLRVMDGLIIFAAGKKQFCEIMIKEIDIEFSPEIAAAAPGLRVIRLSADVVNGPTDPQLRQELEELAARIKQTYLIADINKRPGIAATRAVYKALGKDPNRYRPSQEQLMRRIVNDKGLYFISNLVDVCNYVSVACGCSIGAFDSDAIDGDILTLGAGRAGEPYEGIGRGPLNIEGLPVYRDRTGGVGTPTSDNERTKVSDTTRRLTVCINVYGAEMTDDEVIGLYVRMLRRYCGAGEVAVRTFTPGEAF